MGLFNPKPEVRASAVRLAVQALNKVKSFFNGTYGALSSSTDTTCNRLGGLDGVPPLVRGVVIRAGIGSYDCEVRIGGAQSGTTIVCQTLAPVLSDLYGVSQACMPVPGSTVLVYAATAGLTRTKVARGIILGVIPENGVGVGGANGAPGVSKFADTEFPEGGAAQFTESGYAAIATDKGYPYHDDYQCGRPHDVVPGEYAMLSHSGAGLVIGALSTSIKGSEAASVRCSALDDQVRVTSGHFRHISAAGSEEIFDDGGFISVESAVSLYQPERLGVKSFGTKAFDWRGGSLTSLKEQSSGIEQLKPTQTAKKRLYRYSGYLGDVVNVFVANPDPDKDVEDMDSESDDQGLMHYHVDSSGRFTMRSAGGIMLERYDRIPVPKRRHYAWDPQGDAAESSQPSEKKGFELDDKYPMGIGLSLADMAAWWDHLSYARFRQFDKDFTLREQKDLKAPDNDYDTIGKGEEEYEKYDTRHSYIGLTPDGGIVLRDAWGSEIVMADGRITFNAAGNIEVRSGSSVVIMGGHDVIAKAHDSVDVSATEKDVRVKAQGNMQLVSVDRGVLIQSKAKSDASESAWDKAGEELQSAGVVIKADEAAVAVLGKRTEMQGVNSVSIASFKDGGPSGNVIISGQSVVTTAKGNVVSTANGTSGVVISEQSAMVVAPSVLCVGGQSAADISGNQMMLGIPVDVGSMYSSVVSICKSYVQQYLSDVKWLNPYPPKVFSKIDFKYRTSKEYGTDKDSGVSGKQFSVYEPSWAVMADAGRTLMQSVKTKAWEEKQDSDGGYPWPGKDAMGSSYVTYQEKNVNKNGVEEPKESKPTLTAKSFMVYHIREKQ
jgi:hypothetical protein